MSELHQALRRADYADTNALAIKARKKDELIAELARLLRELAAGFALRTRHASGPGWSNYGLTVVVRSWPSGDLREETIQGRDFDSDMETLHRVVLRGHMELERLAAVKLKLGRRP